MRLDDIDFHGLGRFTNELAGFCVDKYHLDEPWSYIYSTHKLLLKVDQRGPDYVQFLPPGGSLLVRRERFQKYPSALLWIKSSDDRAFTNFYGPTVGIASFSEPKEFRCDYRPERALYYVKQDGIQCETEIFIPEDEAVVVMKYTVTNTASEAIDTVLIPAIRPHFAAGSLAPWDVPSLYQKVGYSNDDNHHLFFMELRSPAGLPELREYGFVLTDFDATQGAEVDCARFIGTGSFDSPQALMSSSLAISSSEEFRYGDYSPENSTNGEQGVAALRKELCMQPEQSYSFTVVMGMSNVEANGIPPSYEDIISFKRYFCEDVCEAEKKAFGTNIRDFAEKRSISTPDEAFNRYVCEYLPLQLRWVGLLDRGWPTGMRGVRDNSQDITAFVPLDPGLSRSTLEAIFNIQRADGWFPRQYSVKGKHGNHDLRNFVDAGVWVWELLYDYLCFTKDYDLLSERIDWLDSDDKSTVLDHVNAMIGYYLASENIGEHGLCKIRGGDWNDSVNRAGLEGRGESVMVSCQVVLMLKQAAKLFDYVAELSMGLQSSENLKDKAAYCRNQAEEMKSNILTYALNSDGYLNSVFNDDGKWIFSPSDPDGKKRVNIPVNSFGIISGVISGENADKVFETLIGMKTRDGWPLFYPAIGDPPIPKLGRIGQGDLAPGLGENGTPYNHGCHGFFGRAAAEAGRGDLLLEILCYMLPYDQECHPVERSKTAPYGVVNHWKTAPGVEGKGGDCFLSGSISTALRNIYNGMFGIRPQLGSLLIKPSLPSGWPEASVEFDYLGANIKVTYISGDNSPKVTVNGDEVPAGSDFVEMPDKTFENGKNYQIIYSCR